MAIMWPNAMMGEVTLPMAEAVVLSPAPKILIPLHQERVFIVGASREPLPHLVDTVINECLQEVFSNV